MKLRLSKLTLRLSKSEVILMPLVPESALILFSAAKVVPRTVWSAPLSATLDKIGWYVVASSVLGIMFGAEIGPLQEKAVVKSSDVFVKVARTTLSVCMQISGVPDLTGMPSILA